LYYLKFTIINISVSDPEGQGIKPFFDLNKHNQLSVDYQDTQR